MNQVMNDRPDNDDDMEQIVGALGSGVIFVDAEGEVAWMDETTRRSIDGGLKELDLPVRKVDAGTTVDCFMTDVDVRIKGERRSLCVIQATPSQNPSDRELRNLIVAVEEMMADPSWFTRPLIEKLKAVRQASQPAPQASDLYLLTAREREILALICEGRTDVEMGRMLNLSQNTVRNHVASLFRKIGVNRRSAAVIWARERAITKHDVLALPGSKRARRQPQG